MQRSEWKFACGWGLVVLLITCAPYVLVWWPTPLDGVFPLVLFNSDDQGVYYSWMKQAQDGRWLFRNLFTTEPQRGAYFHLYFLLLGWLSRLPGLDIPLAYHLGRVVCGTGVLALAYRLGACFTADRFTRRCIFWTVALSAGVGWLFWSDRITQGEPVDVWQPEALTFFSLYANGLFAVSLALMLGVVICLLLAEERGSRWAVGAGVCGLILGNVHSYDMIHLAAVWLTFLLVRWGAERRFPTRAVQMACLAAAVASPSVVYMAWLYLSEPVFKARADTATLSPRLPLYLLGYGLLVPLAAAGLWSLLGRNQAAGGLQDAKQGAEFRWLLPAWMVAGLLVAYAPFAFQRKMVMGLHFPVAILAGLAVAQVGMRLATVLRAPAFGAAALIALLCPSSLRAMVRDVTVANRVGTTSTYVHPVYWDQSLFRGFQWINRATPPDAALLMFPPAGIFAPAVAGRAVYAGHWGETPRFQEKIKPVHDFFWGNWTAEQRREFLREARVAYVVDTMQKQFAPGPPLRPLSTEAFLTPVFQEGSTTIYAVRP